MLDLAFKGIFAHSYLPLRLITVTGVCISFGAVLAVVILTIRWFIVGVPFAGFGTIVSLLLLAFGGLAFMMGILSEYVGLIYEEVKQRPNYVVRDRLGI